MIFNNIQLNDREFNFEGQFRITENNELKLSFSNSNFAQALKIMHEKSEVVNALVVKEDNNVKYEGSSLKIHQFTLDNKDYHATLSN